MKIYDSLTKELKEFSAGEDKIVRMYLCGPTVYDLPHLGHGRSAVNFDLMRRYLIYKGQKEGLKVQFASNYTDIDDKMINRAAEEGISVTELAEKIIPEYIKDYDALGVMTSDFSPRATDHVQEMIKMVKLLSEKDIAYKLVDGWYFDIKKFHNYGNLSGQDLNELKAGARVDLVEGKRNPQDFVLWKLKKDGEPSWKDKILGEGRPGWHIECSAMIHDVFEGKTIDIHGGGEDLRFPHHECEIAQSECTYKNEFVRYWVHNAFVMVNKEKMSKSLNNFKTLRELFKTIDPMVIRFFYLQHHYRAPIDFHDEALQQAKNGLSRFAECYKNIATLKTVESSFTENDFNLDLVIEKTLNGVEQALENDFDTSEAIKILYDFVSSINKVLVIEKFHQNQKNKILHFFDKMNLILGFLKPSKVSMLVNNTLEKFNRDELNTRLGNFSVQEDLEWVVSARLAARAEKDFKASDEIRDFLKEKGVLVEDTKDGTIVNF